MIGGRGTGKSPITYIGLSPPRVSLFWRSLVLEARKGGAQPRLTFEFWIWVVLLNFQVHIFWEDRKIWRNLPLSFALLSDVNTYQVCNVKTKREMSSSFYGFCFSVNFNYIDLCKKGWSGWCSGLELCPKYHLLSKVGALNQYITLDFFCSFVTLQLFSWNSFLISSNL